MRKVPLSPEAQRAYWRDRKALQRQGVITRPRQWPPEVVEHARVLRLQGLTLKQIVDELNGPSIATINIWTRDVKPELAESESR